MPINTTNTTNTTDTNSESKDYNEEQWEKDIAEGEKGNIGNNDMLANNEGNHDEENYNQEELNNTVPIPLKDLEESLRNSKKGILGDSKNSKRFDAVHNSLKNVLECINKSLPSNDIMKAQKTIINTMQAYTGLLAACAEYSNRRFFGISPRGKHRYAIIKQIKKMAQKDIDTLRNYLDIYSTLPREQRGKNVAEVIGTGRQRVLELDGGKKESDLKHVGGEASYLGVINKGDLVDKDVSGYFKEEDIYTKQDGGMEALQVLEQIRERMNASDENYRQIREFITGYVNSNKESTGIIMEIKKQEKYKNDIEFHNFVDVLYKACKSKGVVDTHLNTYLNIHLKEGQSINMSKRNVAASRIANLLGIGDSIAQSETAQLKDAEGNTKTGNLMQAARGIIANNTAKDIVYSEFQEESAEKGGDTISGKESILTPEFVKSLTSLQVLDNLIGQVDRHMSNYLIEMTGKGLGRVQGIDNDFAFGHGESKSYGLFMTGAHGRSIFKGKVTSENEDKAELSIPYMDKALAERICEVTEQDVRLLLYDVLEPEAVDSFVHRLKIVQRVIGKELKEKSDRYLDKDEDWGKDGVLGEYLKDGESYVTGTRTYVGTFLSQMRMIKIDAKNEYARKQRADVH